MVCLYHKDSEIYENYILNRLSNEEKSEFEGHLNSCKTCQDRLEKEKWLQANLREIGKREMKAEIRKQVEMMGTGRNLPDWGMIMRVAAVILFVVITPGVIYYYQYLAPQPDEQMLAKFSDAEKEESLSPLAGSDQYESGAGGQITRQQPVTSELKKTEREGKVAGRSQVKTFESVEKEKIPAEVDDLANEDKLGEVREGIDTAPLKTLSQEVQVAGEIEKNIRRSEPAAARAADETVFRYDAEQPTVNGFNENSGYYRSKELSKSEVNQKIWLFRKSDREITMRLQLLDEKRDKDQELSQIMPAQVTIQDSLRLIIDCQVTPEFYDLNPDSVTLYQPNPQTLQIQLPKQMMYEIDLTRKSQEAVQIRQ